VRESCKGLVDYVSSRYGTVAEIGIGGFPDVAMALTWRGLCVLATDTRRFSYQGLQFFVDDITAPEANRYRGVELLYALRPPPELVPYMATLARALPADLIVKPLASDHVGRRLTRYGGTTFFLWEFI